MIFVRISGTLVVEELGCSYNILIEGRQHHTPQTMLIRYHDSTLAQGACKMSFRGCIILQRWIRGSTLIACSYPRPLSLQRFYLSACLVSARFDKRIVTCSSGPLKPISVSLSMNFEVSVFCEYLCDYVCECWCEYLCEYLCDIIDQLFGFVL